MTKHKLAAIGSFACIVHCIGLPFLVMASPLVGHILENIWIELGVLAFSILCGVFIIYQGYCNHKKKHAAVLFALGACFWLANTAIELYIDAHLHFELLIVGTIFILIAYRVNHRQSKTCCDHHNS